MERFEDKDVEVLSSHVVILEGIYALSEKLCPLLDLRVFVAGGVHFDLVKWVLRDIQRVGQKPEEIIYQISEMYKTPTALANQRMKDNLSNKLELQNHEISPVMIPRDNMSNEFEIQNHEIIKEDPVCVLNCLRYLWDDVEVKHSGPKKTCNIDGELFVTVSIQSPSIVLEAISKEEYKTPTALANQRMKDNLSNKLELQNHEISPVMIPRDNMSNEFEIQNHEIIKEDPVCVLNCLRYLWDDVEVKHSGPKKTCNIDGELFVTVSIQSPSIVLEAISKEEYEKIDNWLRDNVINEFEQLSHGTVKDDIDMVYVVLSKAIKTSEKDVLIKITDKSAYVTLFDGLDNLVDIRNEFGQLSHSAMKDEMLSVAPFDVVKKHEKDILYQDVDGHQIKMGNQNE
ncbi:CYTH-like domain-containing protein [Artemisia annua]|uniref:CYTH-like domain-containing protein n=1 Tax=Artemisia annua TaxID=35608 RepID=A0A2U1QFL0_ARTAN|nr:CYTH-like domain-containing protein [Artemisia annua]